jgi:protein SCO1/2
MTLRFLPLLAIVFWAGCGRTVVTPKAASQAKTYPVVGVVEKIDVKEGRLTLRHEAIPGYMDAMTMPFHVGPIEKTELADLQVGDKVAATLKVSSEESTLVGIRVTEMAQPPELTLDLSGAAPVLRPKIAKLEPGAEVPDFRFILEDGSSIRLSDLREKVVVLTFIYTRCPLPDFCPRMDGKFGELSKMVGAVPRRGDEVRLLSISFDPEHDTPEVLAKHAQFRGAKSPLWRFGVASHDELRKVAEPLGLTYGPRENEITHNLSTAVIGPSGKLIALFPGSSWSVEDVFKTIKSAIPK